MIVQTTPRGYYIVMNRTKRHRHTKDRLYNPIIVAGQERYHRERSEPSDFITCLSGKGKQVHAKSRNRFPQYFRYY